MVDGELTVYRSGALHPYWGKTGHYTIASFACEQVPEGALRTLLTANADRISVRIGPQGRQVSTELREANAQKGFVPLADVPDLIWKNLPSAVPGGRDTAFRSGPEHPNHYADIDQPLDGTTLRERCVADPTQVTVPVWQDYYTRLGKTAPDDRGLLPFRVQQFFGELVAAARASNAVRFVAAAGLVAHYVGDACQPLHGSYLSDGLPDGTGKGVHSAYETTMVDRHEAELVEGTAAALPKATWPAPLGSAADAAGAVVALMDRSARAVDPRALVDAYAAVASKPDDASVTVTDALWLDFGAQTTGLMVDGAVTLAGLWHSAWTLGGGDDTVDASRLVAIDTADLQHLYEQPAFVPSLTLDEIGAVLG